MKAAIVLALSLSYAVPALAESGWKQHEAEARRFLATCSQTDAKDRRICLESQRTFVKIYVDAMAGDLASTATLIFVFDRIDNDYVARTSAVGIPPNQIEACAWTYFLFKTQGQLVAYKDAFVSQCASVSEGGREAAMIRVKEIADSFDLNAKPPANWKPRIDGLREVKP